LTNEDIVIADGEHAIGLAGIMGGGNSEVDDQTKDVVLEVATFDMYTLRKSSMRHGIFTDALTRFNKGQSPLQNDYVLCALMAGIREYAGAIEASAVQDKKIDTVEPTIMTSVEFINARLGLSLTSQEMWTLLSQCRV